VFTGLVPGDVLLLTKPLGTGTLTTAVKRDELPESALAAVVAGMLQTNAAAVPLLHAAGVRVATDVTGFGLLGHAAELAAASKVEVVLTPAAVPDYVGARAMLLAKGVRTGANPRNHQ
jgi:selenide,water dikinase